MESVVDSWGGPWVIDGSAGWHRSSGEVAGARRGPAGMQSCPCLLFKVASRREFRAEGIRDRWHERRGGGEGPQATEPEITLC